jgi:hypothetical protein
MSKLCCFRKTEGALNPAGFVGCYCILKELRCESTIAVALHLALAATVQNRS